MHARFALLNIQGLVTKFTNKLHLDELETIFRRNDFVLLIETWAGDFSELSVLGFNLIQLNRVGKKQNTKRNSGGIALYVRQSFFRYCFLLEKDCDDIIWIKIEGQLFNLSDDLYLCLCYIIPSTSSRESLVEIDVLERITNSIIKIANDTNNCYNVLICGDFNSRIGNQKDYVIFDNDVNIDILPLDYEIDTIIPRFSQDNTINTNGRKLLDFCRQNGLRVVNGRVGEDKGVGKYTYVGSTGCSVIDYVIVNSSLLDVFSTFHVGDPNILTDHCMLEFSFLCTNINGKVNTKEKVKFEQVSKKYIWNDERAGEYFFSLDEEETVFKDLSANLSELTSSQQIDDNILKFCTVMEQICDPLFSKKVYTTYDKDNTQSREFSNRSWYDEECRHFRISFNSALNTYRRDKSALNQSCLVEARSKYKKILRHKRHKFMKEKTCNLITSKSKNVKEYWKLLKQAAHITNKCSIDAKRFAEYFQSVSASDDRYYQPDEDIIFFNERYVQGEFQVMF